MKIIICFDGTWNHPAEHNFRHKSLEVLKLAKHQNWKKAGSRIKQIIQEKTAETNVKKISHGLIDESNHKNASQKVKYIDGLGTGWFGDRILGGATGLGISKKIKEAYEYIVKEYVKGADIYLFGFSRGAYTARSLSGFVDLVGVLDEDKRKQYKKDYGRDLLSDAYKYYRLPIKKPESKIKRQFYQKVFGAQVRSEYMTISGEQFEDTLENTRRKDYEKIGDKTIEVNLESITIEFLGVWDTVGALGVPFKPLRFVSSPWVGFHDTELSKNVIYAYQALALHEIRSNFKPVFWTKKHPGNKEVQQLWFPGSHSDVGGGYKDARLSDYALFWMIEKAKDSGLRFLYSRLKLQSSIEKTVAISRKGIHKLQPKEIRPIDKRYAKKYVKLYFQDEISNEILENIFIHPCVCTRLNNSDIKKQYDKESSFMVIDALSSNIKEPRNPCPMNESDWEWFLEIERFKVIRSVLRARGPILLRRHKNKP